MQSDVNYLRAARIISEDLDALTIEVRKANRAPRDVDRGDPWVMVVFVREDDKRSPEPWLPWQTRHPGARTGSP